MPEARVNFKHLLADIRDSYPFPIEEAIVTELIANSLDAKASEIRFQTDAAQSTLRVSDNGSGMEARDFVEYHDVAASTRIRGRGIGFAGVGAKLSLLVATEVITETKTATSHNASRFRLESAQHAPWDPTDPPGWLESSTGTAVCVVMRDSDSLLLETDFIKAVIQNHFLPLLDDQFMVRVLRPIYPNGVKFTVNGNVVRVPELELPATPRVFPVRLGRRGQLVGIGFLSKADTEYSEDKRGVAISTYGKVIKRGWEWVGVSPRNPTRLTGMVEVPALVEILTLNKADFLRDGTSYQKYLRYRKAIQEAVQPILREFGEITTPQERPDKNLQPLEKEIERVLVDMLNDFPELGPLLGRRRRGEPVTGVIPDGDASPAGVLVQGVDVMTGVHGGAGPGQGIEAAPGDLPGDRIEPNLEQDQRGRLHEGTRRRPGLMISFDENPQRDELGWLTENTIWINKAHPAYTKATGDGAETYHIVLSIGWVLCGFIEGEKSPQGFLNRFLSTWARAA
jgi:hypothetical protein